MRALVSGQILQVNIRLGEFAQAGVLGTPLMVLGSVEPLHVRVDIDEHEAWRVRPEAPAVAFVRGNRDLQTPVRFVRFEPYVVPKKSLIGQYLRQLRKAESRLRNMNTAEASNFVEDLA